MHAGTGQDLLRIRAYESGDSARHVDWKATAKSGALKVREFARDEEARVRIVFDNPAPGQVSAEVYERGIRRVASLAWYFARASAQVSFVIPGVAPGFRSSSDVWEFLRFLALAEAAESGSTLEKLPDGGEYNVIVTARPEASIPAALRRFSHVSRFL